MLCPPLNRQEYLEACTIITFMVSMWYFVMAIFKLGEPLAILVSTRTGRVYCRLFAFLVIWV